MYLAEVYFNTDFFKQVSLGAVNKATFGKMF